MGSEKSDENTPNQSLKNYLLKLSAQAQMFGISMKKGFIGRP